MNEVNLINSTIKEIFTEPKLRDVLCSLYDNDLKPIEILSLLGIELEDVNRCLTKLYQLGLVTNQTRDGEEFYSVTNTKICDAILTLKDELYRVLHTRIGNNDY